MRFSSLAEADAFLGPMLDRPEPARRETVAPGVSLVIAAIDLGDGAFSNLYTLSWTAPARADIDVFPDAAASPWSRGHALARCGMRGAVATGGFSFLADDAAAAPRARCLNLAIWTGEVLSLPVVDQDALVARAGALAVEHVPAAGLLRLNGDLVRWSGARTERTAECVVFGNASARIVHSDAPATGKRRHLVANTRWTPALSSDSGYADVGFLRGPGRVFRGAAVRADGGLDIFAYDLVLRCPAERLRRAAPDNTADPRTVGPIDLSDPSLAGAVSVGPSLLHPALEDHPLHREPSLGSNPLLGGRRASRLVYFGDAAGQHHLQLWDARPGSRACPGVTLDEAAHHARAHHDVAFGCFLDSGKSGKLCVVGDAGVASYGNRHYLRWPAAGEGDFVWTPDAGRPAASLLVITAPA